MSDDSGDVRDDQADGGSSGESDLVSRHLWQFQAFRDVALIAVVVGVVWLGYALSAVTVPLLIALGLAYLFEPVVRWLERARGWSRSVIAGGLIVLLGGVGVLLVAIAVPVVIGQTVDFANALREGRYNAAVGRAIEIMPERYRADMTAAHDWFDAWISSTVENSPLAIGGTFDAGGGSSDTTREGAPVDASEESGTPESGEDSPQESSEGAGGSGGDDSTALESGDAREGLAGSAGDESVGSADAAGSSLVVARDDDERIRAIVREELQRAGDANDAGVPWVGTARTVLDYVGSFIVGVIQTGLLLFLIPFYFFAFSVNWPRVVEFLGELVPIAHRKRTFHLVSEMDKAVSGFVRGRIVISLIMGVMLAIGWFFCGVPYSILIGLLVGVFCAVPYLGAIGIPVAVGLLLIDQYSMPDGERMSLWWMLLAPTVVFGVVQLIEGYVLTPLIAGKATNLDPVTIVVAVLAGGALLGVYGMLLAIPIAACIKIVIREIIRPRVQQWIRGRASDPLPLES